MESRVFGIGLSTIDILYKEKEHINKSSNKELEYLGIGLGGTIGTVLAVIGRLGGTCYYCGLVGQTTLGKLKGVTLMDNGVNVLSSSYVDQAEQDLVLVKINRMGERSFASATTHQGNVKCLEVFKMLQKGDFLLLDGHYADDVIPFLEILKEKEEGITVIVSVSKPEPNLWPQDVIKVLYYADIIVGGSGAIGKVRENPVLCEQINRKSVVTIETDGSNPIVYTRGEERYTVSVNRNIHVIDTTGAGDFFLGAYIWTKLMKQGDYDSIRFASNIASESCQYYGTEYLKHLKSRGEKWKRVLE